MVTFRFKRYFGKWYVILRGAVDVRLHCALLHSGCWPVYWTLIRPVTVSKTQGHLNVHLTWHLQSHHNSHLLSPCGFVLLKTSLFWEFCRALSLRGVSPISGVLCFRRLRIAEVKTLSWSLGMVAGSDW